MSQSDAERSPYLSPAAPVVIGAVSESKNNLGPPFDTSDGGSIFGQDYSSQEA